MTDLLQGALGGVIGVSIVGGLWAAAYYSARRRARRRAALRRVHQWGRS